MKIGINGKVQWQKRIGGSGEDTVSLFTEARRRGFYFLGNSQSYDGDLLWSDTPRFMAEMSGAPRFQNWLVRADRNGEILWQKFVGEEEHWEARRIRETTDGGCIIAGVISPDYFVKKETLDNEDILLIRLDPEGNVVWKKRHGREDVREVISDIQTTNDGGFIGAGFQDTLESWNCWSVRTNCVFLLSKFDENGNPVWNRTVGSAGRKSPGFERIQQTKDGGFICAGDGTVFKLDSDGSIEWRKEVDCQTRQVRQTLDDGYICAGDTTIDAGSDIVMIQFDKGGNVIRRKSIGGSNYDQVVDIRETEDKAFILVAQTQSTDGDVVGFHFSPGRPIPYVHSFPNPPDIWVVKVK